MGAPTTNMNELLSAYRDGELGPADRARVEQALASDPKLVARLADLDALSFATRATLHQAADEPDFKGFADRVMARTTAHKPPFFERLSVGLSELFEYRRARLFVGAGVAAAAVMLLAVGGPLLLRGSVGGSGTDVARAPTIGGGAVASAPVTVRSVKTADDKEPILLTSKSGTAVIFVRNK